MPTLNVDLSGELRSFVDRQVAERGLESCSDYIRNLVQLERDRQHLRDLIMEGVNSPSAVVADDAFFDEILVRIDRAEQQWHVSRSS
ncbi:MAG: type II toxin-antitoxin system ParD family antitoxin [Chloroflexi bacterium]|nr:type II toxin-antitoxin system ParD family antitoxin [Chloroflexota bacterium]